MKGGNMILNRFCIDEDGAFEISGVNYFKKRLNALFLRMNVSSNSKEKIKERSSYTNLSFLS